MASEDEESPFAVDEEAEDKPKTFADLVSLAFETCRFVDKQWRRSWEVLDF
jgi:hypothetical protein